MKTIEELVSEQAQAAWMDYDNDMGDDYAAFVDAVSDKFLPLLQSERARASKLVEFAKKTATTFEGKGIGNEAKAALEAYKEGGASND